MQALRVQGRTRDTNLNIVDLKSVKSAARVTNLALHFTLRELQPRGLREI